MKRFGDGILSFLVYSNLFIAGCALLMVNQTCRLLLHTSPGIHLAGFVFFSTICSYSFHWYLTTESQIPSHRINWLLRYRWLHVVLFITGLLGAVFFLYYLLPWWPWLLLSAVVTFLYSAPKIPHPYFRLLRRVALGKTIFLAFVWMYVTTILPIIIGDASWNTGFILFVLHRFFYIYAICVLFDYRDRSDDKASGIRSLITFLDEKSISLLFYISLIIGGGAAAAMFYFGYTPFQVTLLLVPVLVTALLFNYARKNFSDMLYYLVLDGLMAGSALLMLLFS